MAPRKRPTKSIPNDDDNTKRMHNNNKKRGKRPATSLSTSSESQSDSDLQFKKHRPRKNRRRENDSTSENNSEDIDVDESDEWVDDALEDSTSDSSSDDELSRRIDPTKPINCFGKVLVNLKETYFRSNLRTLIKDINGLKFSEAHVCWIKRTPFWLLFESTYGSCDKQFLKRMRKNDDAIRKILKCFDQQSETFFIGGKILELERRDAQLIWGVSCGNKHISLRESDYTFPKWMYRCFPEEIRRLPVCQFVLYKNLILTKLKGALQRTDIDSIKDVARLLSLFILAILLCPNQNSSVSVHLGCYFESFTEVCNYDWATLIVEMLRMQIKNSKNLKAGGCAAMLPFWLCEHASIVKPADKLAIPRFLKWDLRKVNKEIPQLKLIKQVQIRKFHLKATADEKIKLRALIEYREAENLNESRSVGRMSPEIEEEAEGNCSVNQNRCTSIVLLQKPNSELGSSGRGFPSGEGCSFNASIQRGIESSVKKNQNVPHSNEDAPLRASENVVIVQKSGCEQGEGNGSESRSKCFNASTQRVIETDGNTNQNVPNSNEDAPLMSENVDNGQKITCPPGEATESGPPEEGTESQSKMLGEIEGLPEKAIAKEKSPSPDSHSPEKQSPVRCTSPDQIVVSSNNEHLASKVSKLDPLIDSNPHNPHIHLRLDKFAGINTGHIPPFISEAPSWSLGMTQDFGNKDLANQTINKVIADLSTIGDNVLQSVECSSPNVARNLLPELDNNDNLENFVEVNVESDHAMYSLEKGVGELEAVIVQLRQSIMEKDKLIQQLSLEKVQLQDRVSELTEPPSATQVMSNPVNIHLMDASVELHVLKQNNKDLLMENAYLKECLDKFIQPNPGDIAQPSDTGIRVKVEISPAEVKNLKRGANHPDPSTITRAVKRRTVNDERIPKDYTPQPSTKELIIIGEGEQALGKNKAKAVNQPKFVLNEKMQAVKSLSNHIKEKLFDDWEFKGPEFLVWTGNQPLAEVSVQNVLDILEERRIPFEVIDAWADICQSLHSNQKPCVKYTVTFTAMCWSLINDYGNTKDKNKTTLIDNRIEEALGADWVLFPILGRGGSHKHSGSSDHWTLLKLNVKKGEWRFLNSMLQRSRSRVDVHLRDAVVVVKYFDRKFREACKKHYPNHPYMKKSLQLPQIEDCLQQKEGTLDCGVIVCYHIENTMINKSSRKGEYSVTCSANYRKRMVELFMDPHGSKI